MNRSSCCTCSMTNIIRNIIPPAMTECSASYQAYPSKYAFRTDSLYRTETSTTICGSYPLNGSSDGIHPELYTYCYGTQLRLTDSDLGSEQYTAGEYYVWTDAGSSGSQLLFIFPTLRVNLTTITLHYYSDTIRGLPRLRFYAVPDNFEIWNIPAASYSFVDIAAVPPGGEPAGRRNVKLNVDVNIITNRILMYKFSSSFILAVSEVEFFTCIINHPYSKCLDNF